MASSSGGQARHDRRAERAGVEQHRTDILKAAATLFDKVGYHPGLGRV